MTLGRATYEPGWRWSEHVGEGLCQVEHVALVLSRGCRGEDGGRHRRLSANAGEFFRARGHDSWSLATSRTCRCT